MYVCVGRGNTRNCNRSNFLRQPNNFNYVIQPATLCKTKNCSSTSKDADEGNQNPSVGFLNVLPFDVQCVHEICLDKDAVKMLYRRDFSRYSPISRGILPKVLLKGWMRRIMVILPSTPLDVEKLQA